MSEDVTIALATERVVPIAELGDELSGLRMCESAALEAMRRSLARHGQLTALVTYRSELGSGLEIIDGFKRLRAAQALEWRELHVIIAADTTSADAKVRIAELHDGRGLTEIEEAWLVHALCRQDGLAQGAVAQRLGRHKSWVCRRLLLVEALDPAVQADVRLGLLAPRAAVALAQLPRGNQMAAAEVVVRRGLTVRQTEQLVAELLECDSVEKREQVLASWQDGSRIPAERMTSRRRLRSEAEWMLADIATVCRVAARLQARLLGTPLSALGEGPEVMVRRALINVAPVLDALANTIVDTTIVEPARGADP